MIDTVRNVAAETVWTVLIVAFELVDGLNQSRVTTNNLLNQYLLVMLLL